MNLWISLIFFLPYLLMTLLQSCVKNNILLSIPAMFLHLSCPSRHLPGMATLSFSLRRRAPCGFPAFLTLTASSAFISFSTDALENLHRLVLCQALPCILWQTKSFPYEAYSLGEGKEGEMYNRKACHVAICALKKLRRHIRVGEGRRQ